VQVDLLADFRGEVEEGEGHFSVGEVLVFFMCGYYLFVLVERGAEMEGH
jgi:hypothetical protein